MKIWCLSDGDKLDEFYPFISEAVIAARQTWEAEQAKGHAGRSIVLTEYKIPTPITRWVICRVMTRRTFAEHREVWRDGNWVVPNAARESGLGG